LIVELAARFDDLPPILIKRHPDDPQIQLALARSLAKRGKQHLNQKQPGNAQAELEKAREVFTRVRGEPRWSVLTATEMKSEVGAKMDLQKDGSVFVHQSERARGETYTLLFSSPMKGIQGLRLEALADSRLPKGGPGWKAGRGNFVLTELTLEAAPAGSPDQPRPIALRNASADFSESNLHVGDAIDGNPGTGWAIDPELNKDHTALFELAEEVGDGQGTRLTVRLHHQWPVPGYILGRFRVSVTDDATTLRATRIRQDLNDNEMTDLYAALGKAHAQQGHTNEAVAAFTEAISLAADRANKSRIIAEAASLAGLLEKLAEQAPDDALIQAELARHLTAAGNAALAESARAKARALFEDELAKEPTNAALAADLFSAYQSAGRTREAVPHLAKASAAHPEDARLSLKVAALEAWFGQE
jgi:tetratricopeptide (TPR) repeat protein